MLFSILHREFKVIQSVIDQLQTAYTTEDSMLRNRASSKDNAITESESSVDFKSDKCKDVEERDEKRVERLPINISSCSKDDGSDDSFGERNVEKLSPRRLVKAQSSYNLVDNPFKK